MVRNSYLLGVFFVAMLAGTGWANARPYTPADDGEVLERLPERADPALAELKRMRAALRAHPDDLDNASRVARRSIEAARMTGDPRFLGQAQAALAPWWFASDPPATALLLRATLKQSQHDFAGARVDLDRLIAAQPSNGQALLTRATIFTVQGQYAEAKRDCAKLFRLTSALVTSACFAGAASLNGEAASAYRGLLQALDRPGEEKAARAWALTLAGEIAQRRGDAAAANSHFQQALEIESRDAYLLGAYADFLLDQGRAREVVPLLAAHAANDSLLLRLALAEMALPALQGDFVAHRREVADRFAAAKRRGDTLHLREEARFRLEIAQDIPAALVLAMENWKVQREPADLRILAMAANASAGNDGGAMKIVNDWLARTRIEDVAVVALAGGRAR